MSEVVPKRSPDAMELMEWMFPEGLFQEVHDDMVGLDPSDFDLREAYLGEVLRYWATLMKLGIPDKWLYPPRNIVYILDSAINIVRIMARQEDVPLVELDPGKIQEDLMSSLARMVTSPWAVSMKPPDRKPLDDLAAQFIMSTGERFRVVSSEEELFQPAVDGCFAAVKRYFELYPDQREVILQFFTVTTNAQDLLDPSRVDVEPYCSVVEVLSGYTVGLAQMIFSRFREKLIGEMGDVVS